MPPLLPTVIALLLGAALGALATFAKFRPPAVELAALRLRVEAADAQLAEMRRAASMLRHDLRGILSPALLTADRLSNSQDASVRKSADIVIRCVDRASARLSDKPPVQEEAKSVLG